VERPQLSTEPAATAVTHGLVLATNNLRDFGRIPHLQIDNWLAEP
jgi:predicted nucleic acid-binding protein